MQTLTPNEAIHEFYRLKSNYERNYNEKYVSPIVKDSSSKKVMKYRFNRLPKPECINCKRNVSTLFSVTNNDKESVREFKAICGDRNAPCPLNIHIKMSYRVNMENAIEKESKELDKMKLNVIKEKNNALFFEFDTLNKFEENMNALLSKTELIGMYNETLMLRNDNPEHEKNLKHEIEQFNVELLKPFKDMINECEHNNYDVKMMNDALQFYVKELTPKMYQIRDIKYDVKYVEYDEDHHEYRLIQRENSYEKYFYYVQDIDKVVSMKKGMANTKTLKKRAPIKSTKQKTKKKILSLESDEDSESEIEAKPNDTSESDSTISLSPSSETKKLTVSDSKSREYANSGDEINDIFA